MTIGSVSSTSYLQSTTPVNDAKLAKSAQSSLLRSNKLRGNGIVGAMEKTFEQMGLSFTEQSFKKWQVNAVKGGNESVNGVGPRPSFQRLKSTLLAAITNTDRNQTSLNIQNEIGYANSKNLKTTGYSDLVSKVQILAERCQQSEIDGKNSTAGTLQKDFQQFIDSMELYTGDEVPQIKLSDFIKNIADNMKGQQASASDVGNFVSTSA